MLCKSVKTVYCVASCFVNKIMARVATSVSILMLEVVTEKSHASPTVRHFLRYTAQSRELFIMRETIH